jgi:hypothetical protein
LNTTSKLKRQGRQTQKTDTKAQGKRNNTKKQSSQRECGKVILGEKNEHVVNDDADNEEDERVMNTVTEDVCSECKNYATDWMPCDKCSEWYCFKWQNIPEEIGKAISAYKSMYMYWFCCNVKLLSQATSNPTQLMKSAKEKQMRQIFSMKL